MTSSFNVQEAAGYDQIMGRWSKVLAPLFIDFSGLEDGESVLDVGCGTGSLTFALAEAKSLKQITAIDFSPVFVDAVKHRNTDPRISVSQADACDLPFADGEFDRAMALLVLHFVPDAGKAIGEMRRVVRSGGTVGAVVWDHYGGMCGMRMMVDTVAALSESGRRLRAHYCFQPMVQPGEMKQAFLAQGLNDVADTQLMIRMNYENFDDYWAPIAAGEGPLGKYVVGLEATERSRMGAAVRDAYEAGRGDGPRSFANVAWACKGTVP